MKNDKNKAFCDKIHEISNILKDIVLSKEDFGLLGGNSGILLFLFVYSKWADDTTTQQLAINRLNRIIEDMETIEDMDWTFTAGFSGFAYFIEYLSSQDFIEIDTNEMLSEYDSYCHKVMLYSLWKKKYDYFYGGLGIGKYLLSRKDFPMKNDYLIDIIGVLYKTREIISDDKIVWFSSSSTSDQIEKDTYDFGIPHGLSGIIILLSQLYKNNINRIKISLLIEPLVQFVLSYKSAKPELSLYPSKFAKGEETYNSRLAWCYGDLSVAIALWHASQALCRKDWEQESKTILLHASKRRDLQNNGVVDAGLCHGTSGIAHIFDRMYRNTGLPECKEAANYWFEQTLKMAKFEDGLAGYKALHLDGLQNEYGLLEGIAGIGLSLISYVSDIDSSWDECLLLS